MPFRRIPPALYFLFNHSSPAVLIYASVFVLSEEKLVDD